MISEYKLEQFLEVATKKRKISWSEIEDFFGEGFIDTKDFDYLLYKLDREDIKVINDSFAKDDKDDLVFESYIDFDTPEMVTRREEIGGKKELKPNNSFKEYLINAYLIMNYKIEDISQIYGISIEILRDWIFVYENNYEVTVPHCYTNKFFIHFSYEVSDSIRINFNEMYKKKNKTDEEIAKSLKIYPSLVKELKTDLKNNNKKDYFYKKALKKIPMWAQNPYQYNHRIIRAYFKAYHRFDEPPTKDMIREVCNTDITCYVDNFQATYSSLKADGPTTNGKLFIDDGVYVQIWEEIEEVLLKFEKYFYNEELDK